MLKRTLLLFISFILITSLSCGCQIKIQKGIKEDWQTAYLNFIEEHKDSYLTYSLVNIDDDDIPELYLSGNCEATGDSICAYKNGNIVQQQLNRIGGGKYIEGSGKIINQNGNMGTIHTHVYRLSNDGFTLTFNALSVERIIQSENGEFEIIYEYSVDDKQVDGIKHDSAIEAVFDFSKSVWLDENAVDYNAIKQQINDY